jgi:putative transposase
MSRQLRVLVAGGLYHVTSRGNERRSVYRSQTDRELFLELLGSVVGRCGWVCHGYCLMGNHYHLVVETPRANLPAGMRQLNGCYAQGCNRRWGRVGHLFQGRYKAILVEKEPYLLELVRYVLLNPVRVGWRDLPEQWQWSSYRALVGLTPRPAWLSNDWLLGQLAADLPGARARWQTFVADGIAGPQPLPIRAGLYLGSDAFIEAHAGERTPIEEVPREQWQPLRPTLTEIYAASQEPAREAHERWGYTLREIGQHTGRHYSTISRRLQRNQHAQAA